MEKKKKGGRQRQTPLPGIGSNLLVDLPTKLKVELEGEEREQTGAYSQHHYTGNQARDQGAKKVIVVCHHALGGSQVGEGLLDLEVLENGEAHHAGAEEHVGKNLNGVLIPELRER